MDEQEKHLRFLGQLKQYDKKLADELVAKAFQEQEIQRLEVFIFNFFSRCYMASEKVN